MSEFHFLANLLASFLVIWITAGCLGDEKLVDFITPSLKRPKSLKLTKSEVSLNPKLCGSMR